MAWLRRVAGLILCAALLLAQQQGRVHPLSHLPDAEAAAHAGAGTHDPAHEPMGEHDAGPCAQCLADAATANLAPAGAARLPGVAVAWRPAAAQAEPNQARPRATTPLIRGPPEAATDLG
jgi:hypothetical protein